ncbi:MAG: hypothetical protein HY897_07695 [Deltaproteobacteria bacterium]|nr:hypothetical protein [Deltaproteobacteria bacterium]
MRKLMWIVLVAWSAASLGCDVGSNGTGADTVGPEGGTVSTENNEAMLEVPAGALDKDVTIEIVETSEVPSGNIGKAFDFKPDGLKFLKPVTITIAYNSGDIQSGYSESFFKLGTVAGGKWEAVAVSSVDTSSKHVIGETDHFTPYGIIGGQECRTDSDCVSQECINAGNCLPLCVNGKCAECAGDEDCGAGQVCRQNLCQDIPKNPCENMGGTCATGSCPSGKHAEGYECTPTGTVCCLTGCVTDSDCAAGEKCQNGSCVAVAECTHLCDCQQGWDCVDGTCIVIDAGDIGVVFCCENAGCPADAPCELRDGRYGTCQGDLDGGTDAGDGGTGECRSDSDCTAGQVCLDGFCTTGGECRSDLDCAAGQVCQNGVCVSEPQDGGTDAGDAGDGGTGECAADSDCAAGQVCVNIGGLNACEEGCRSGADNSCSRFFDSWKCGCGVVPSACAQAPDYSTHTCAEALSACCPACGSDSDCFSGQICVNGDCVTEPGKTFCEEVGGTCDTSVCDGRVGGHVNTDDFYQCAEGCCIGGVPCRAHDDCGGAQNKLWCVEGSCLGADTPCEAAGGYCTIEAQCIGTYQHPTDPVYLNCAYGGYCCLPRGCPDLMDCPADTVCDAAGYCSPPKP